MDADLSDESFPYASSQIINIDGCLVRAFRNSCVGELGYELHIPNQSCEKVFQAIVKAGEKHKLRMAGYRALNSLRTEKGNHLWNADLTTADNPVEAGLEYICRHDGQYLGSKTVKKMQENGVKRKLVHFHLKE